MEFHFRVFTMHVKPQVPIAIVVLSTLLIAGWYVDVARAKQHSALSGFFESEPVDVASRTDGRVSRVLVREGDRVEKGALLVDLDAEPRRLAARAKAAAAEQARQHWVEVSNGARPMEITRQRLVVDEARADVDRLVDGPLPEEVGQAKQRLAEADAQYREAVAGPRPEEVAKARAAERQAWFTFQAAQRGPTEQEVAEAKARLASATAAEKAAVGDAKRNAAHIAKGAVTGQQNDQAQAVAKEANAKRREMQQAYDRADRGTPYEELNASRQAYRQAKAALDLVDAGSRPEDVEAARARRSQAADALSLVERGSRAEDVRAAQARLAQAVSTLALMTSGNRKEDIAQAKAAYLAAEADAKSAAVNLSESEVRAPVGGQVEAVPVTNRDLVNAGQSLVRVDDPTDIWLRVYVPESKLASLKVGDAASLRVDGVAGTVPAVVESVGVKGEFTPANMQSPDERGKQVFAVRLRLRQADARVKAGMFATVVRLGDWQP